MKDLQYQPDPLLDRLSRLQAQMGSLLCQLPRYVGDDQLQGGAALPPEIEVAVNHEFELSAVILDIQLCDLANRLLDDADRVNQYPQLAAHLRETQGDRKVTIQDYLIRKGIIGHGSAA